MGDVKSYSNFNMIGLTTRFAHSLMSLGREDLLISLPKVTEGVTVLIRLSNSLP